MNKTKLARRTQLAARLHDRHSNHRPYSDCVTCQQLREALSIDAASDASDATCAAPYIVRVTNKLTGTLLAVHAATTRARARELKRDATAGLHVATIEARAADGSYSRIR